MVYPIQAIKIPDDTYSFSTEGDDSLLSSLSKINIFLGENNSGKSRLLRILLSNNDINYIPSDPNIEKLNAFIEKTKIDFDAYFKSINLSNFSTIYSVLNQIETLKYIDNHSFELLDQIEKLKEIIDKLERDKSSGTNYVQHSDMGKKLKELFVQNLLIIGDSVIYEEDFKEIIKIPKFKIIYVPILRGMRPLQGSDDVYKSRTIQDYFGENTDIKFEIFTGLASYKKIKDFLLGDYHQRALVGEYEEYLSTNFFDGKRVTLIPSEGKDTLTIKIGDEFERPIFKVGDGIQAIIIATLPLFLNKSEDVLYFIEEPEKLLHPGLQRKLIETLLNETGFENYQYFITTHSNHFLDLTMDFSDISIYALRKHFEEEDHYEKTPKFLIENLSHGDTSSLELLGVRNSSVFLSNCTIWVEGITDRLYFRHYLDLYLKHLDSEDVFKEDFHYSFVEYGGGNITHWSFLEEEGGEKNINVERLCGKLFLIADKDENKESRHEILSERLDNRYYPLECREVENLLSKDVLFKVIKDYEKVDPQMETFEEDDYKDLLLGKFIDDKLGGNRKRARPYQAKSGTIHDKLVFCKKALNHIDNWDDLSDEAQSICEKIYSFISENNK